MADKILHKRNLTSNVTPTTSSLDVGELAINVADAKIFVKQSGSSGEFVRSVLTLDTPNTGSINLLGNITASYLLGTASNATSASYSFSASYAPPAFIDNLVTVGLIGSDTNYNSIKTAVDSITDASVANTYTVRVYPGVYIEDTITLKPYIAIKGDSSISTIVSASNPSASIFVMADQTMVIDMQIQGSTAPNVSAVVYSSPTTPQTNAIAYVENVRFGTNYTNAKVIGSGSSGNCILQCSNVKYGGFTEGNKSFNVGFYVTSGSDGGIGRMQLRNVTSTNGGVAGTDNDQIFALADAPGCTFIVNGCLLTRSTGVVRGTGFKVYNGGQLRLTAVNFQRWIRGIWAPQTGSAPSIDAIALNFENCTTDVQIDHSGSLGKVSGTDTFLKTIINKDAPLYEVNQDPRSITVAKKGGDFTSISASVAYITDSAENNRYVIDVGPGQFTEKQIDMRGKPYVAIRGSDIQTTVIIPSGSGTFDQLIIGPTNEVSFLTLQGNNVAGYSALSMPDVGQTSGTDFAMAHKISIYDYDYGIKVCADTANSTFYGEYLDINGMFSYGVYVSSSNNFSSLANIENYYLFPSNSSGIGNYVVGPSSSLSMYTGLFVGDSTAGSTAIKIEQGAELEAAGLDMQDWDYGVRVPAASPAPEFRIVGSMIHNSTTYDFDVLNTSTRGRFQGIASHEQVNNVSPDFYWNFLDDTDGENDITRKLSVTFADGTHTDATTLIFKGSPMGVMEGGNITTGSGFNITVASGFGYVRDAIDATVYKRIDWVNGNLTLTANSNNYIYLTSAEVLTAAGSIPNNETNIILGRVVTNNTTIELIDQTPYNGEHMSNKLSTFNREALGPVYAAGSTVTEDSTPFKLDVTAGTYFFSENKFTPAGTSSINLTQYYPSASTWARYTSSVVPSNQYASSSALVAMSSSHYTKHTLYGVGEGVDEKYFLVINSNEYSSLVAAENANLPSIPSYFNDGVVALAAIYVQSGSANITQIQDIRPVIGFRAAGVNASSVHGNLLGLSADDHTQYLLVNGARAMSGDLSLGGSNITNVGTMFGTASWANNAVNAITASAATSITFVPPTASFATTASAATSITFIPATASFATTAISASYFSGSISFPNGLIVTGGLVVTSISASSGIIGNLIGTSSWASNAVVAQNGFPFTGSAIVSGSVRVTGSLNILSGSISSSGPQAGLHLSSSGTTLTVLPESDGIRYYSVNTGHTFRVGNVDALNIQAFSLSPITANQSTLGISGVRWGTGFINNIVASGSITTTGSLNILSGSINITNGGVTSSLFGTASNAISASYVLSASYAPTILPDGIVSSSTQIDYNSIQNQPTTIPTASYVLNAVSSSFATSASYAPITLPSGLVSSSTQINTGSFSGSFTGTLIGTSSWAQNVISASFATTSSFAVSASWAPGGAGSNDWNDLINIPSGLVSSSTQINTGSFTGSFTGEFIGTSSWAQNVISASFATTSSFSTSASYAPTILPSGLVSSSTQINTGSFTGSFIGVFTGSVFGTSSVATSASFATTAATASSFTGYINFPNGLDVTGSLFVTGSGLIVSGTTNLVGNVSASRLFAPSITGSLFGTSSWASNAISSSYINPTGLPLGIVSSSVQINTGSFTGSFTGEFIGTSSFAISASYAPTILPTGLVSSSTQIDYNSIQNQPTTIPTASYVLNAVSASFSTTSSFSTSASYAPTILPDGLVSSSTQINTGSFTGSFIGVFTGSVFGTSSVATSSSFATSASFAPDTTFPYVGAAVITGSLTVTGSTGINVTGPVTITGALQAQTKSFKIDHQILLGKKLIYGVLEGPEHGVYVRGRLTRNTIIHLPEEWKWLVDPISITVQLTPIGTQQVLYVQNIENNTVIINSNTPIDCFYFVQATRKDVAPLTTVE